MGVTSAEKNICTKSSVQAVSWGRTKQSHRLRILPMELGLFLLKNSTNLGFVIPSILIKLTWGLLLEVHRNTVEPPYNKVFGTREKVFCREATMTLASNNDILVLVAHEQALNANDHSTLFPRFLLCLLLPFPPLHVSSSLSLCPLCHLPQSPIPAPLSPWQPSHRL